jgi:hypothetical protein
VNKCRTVALLAGLMLAAGCGPTIRYVYTPPANAEGRVCTSQCAIAQQQCHSQQDATYQSCERQHDAAMRSYQACKDAGGKQCQFPPSCYSPSRSECEGPYRQCYSNCGGTVQAVEVR